MSYPLDSRFAGTPAAAAAAGGGAPPEPLVGGDRSMKFDMYFAEHTAPATLFTRIGNPLVATLGAGRSASLTCCGLPRSGKTGSVVGAHPDPGNDMSLGLFPLVVRDLFNRHGATHCIRVARLLPPLRGRAGLWDAIKDRAVVADRCAAWAQLRNEVMHPAGDWDEAQHMLSVPQLAFAGVTAPVQCAVELSPKRRGSNRDGLPYRQLSIHGEHVVSPDAPTLFVTLLYSDMEWEGWVAAAAQLVRAHRRPAAAADAEAAAAAHPLLSSVREVLREEGALHYLLHSFHARRAEQGDVIRSLAALSEAARPAAPTPAPGATPAERRMSARGSPTPLGLDPGRRAPVRER